MRKVIITADDFGMSTVFNSEILKFADMKMISSVSVMVNRNIVKQKKHIKLLIDIARKSNFSF